MSSYYGVELDGSSYYQRAAPLNNTVNSPRGILSVWTKIGEDTRSLLACNVGYFHLFRMDIDFFRILGQQAPSGTVLDLRSSVKYFPSNKNLHILASWDTTIPEAWMYINDVDVTDLVTTDPNPINYSTTLWTVGAYWDGTTTYIGMLSELWFAFGQHLDLTVEGNRRKFINPDGSPVLSLGPNGENPLGGAIPQIYLSGGAESFPTNKGNGGSFETVVGNPKTVSGPLAAFQAIAGHEAMLYYEQTPNSGTFTPIAQLRNITPPSLIKTPTESTIRQQNIDSHVMSVRRRGDIADNQVNLLNTDPTHDVNTGLLSFYVDGKKTGFKLEYADATEWIFSGFVMGFNPETPGREGEQMASIALRPSGPMLVDGVVIQ